MAAEVQREDAVTTAEVLDLLGEEAAVASPARDEDQGRVPTARLLVGERHASIDFGMQRLPQSIRRRPLFDELRVVPRGELGDPSWVRDARR